VPWLAAERKRLSGRLCNGVGRGDRVAYYRSMFDLLPRTAKSLKRDGLGVTLVRAAQFLRRKVDGLRPSQARLRRHRERLERAFDERHGTETARPREVTRSDVVGDRWTRGVAYQPVSPGFDLAGVLDGRVLDYDEFSFVDLGAGKGRALVLAATLPFKRIVGVEYSSTLASIARTNVQRVGGDERIEVVHADAIEYELPDGHVVLFLNNPFDCDAMSQLIANVEASVASSPRRLVVVYYTPSCAALWDEAGFLVQVGRHDGAVVYDTGPPGGAAPPSP
jgi:SAM-dependent methyltransferase